MRLRVRLPEAVFDEDAECSWVLHEPTGRISREGIDRARLLPPAEHVELIAPASRVLLTSTTLPKRNQQRLRQQVLQFAVEDRITVEPERVHVVLGPRLPDSTHAVAVVDREWLGQWVAAFRDMGRAPRSVFVETCLPPLQADAWTVVWRGADGFVRTGEASGMALDTAGPASPPAVLQLALQEATMKASAPTAVIVHPEESSLPDLDGWSSALHVPCVAGETWHWSQWQGPAGLDLLQGELAPRSRLRELLPRLRPAFVIASLILALHIFGTLGHWAVLNHEKSQLQSEMRSIFRTAFPEAQAVVDPPLQMRRQLQALRRAAGEPQSGDFVPLLAQAAQAFAGDSARVRNVSYDRGRLQIDIELGSRSDAEALLQRLRARGSAASLDAVNPRGAGVDARFSFAGKGGA